MSNSALLLKKGMHIEWSGQKGLIRAMEADFAVIDYGKNGKHIIDSRVIGSAYAEGDLTISVPDLPVVFQPLRTQEHISLAEDILQYLRPLDEEATPGSRRTMERVIAAVSADFSDTQKQSIPSVSKLYRWYTAWINNNRNVIPLVIKKPKKERAKQFAPQTLDLAEEVIDSEYLRFNGSNVLQTFREFEKRFRQSGFPSKCITKSSFYDMINALDPIDVTLAREGRDAARRLSRTNKTYFIADFPLQRVEIDAVHLNVGLLDEETSIYIGSPIVYLAIDVFTRCIVGYSISYGTKGGEVCASVMDCLKDCMLPKGHLGWPLSGKPLNFVCDAGPAFRSKTIVSFLANMGCHHHTTETSSPWKKPFIERFNRTLREQFAKKIPGYLGRRVDGKTYDYTMEQLATLTVSQFKEYLEEYIRDVYHHNPHKGLQSNTPYQEAMDCQKMFRPQVTADMTQFNLFRGVEKESTIQAQAGIQINKIHYQSDELKRLYFKLKGNSTNKKLNVTVMYDANDISQITVLDDEKMEMFSVPCRDPIATPGMHEQVYKSLRASKRTEHDKSFAAKCAKAMNSPKRKANKKTTLEASSALEQAMATEQSDEALDDMISEGIKRKARDHSNKQIKMSVSEQTSSPAKITRKRNDIK